METKKGLTTQEFLVVCLRVAISLAWKTAIAFVLLHFIIKYW